MLLLRDRRPRQAAREERAGPARVNGDGLEKVTVLRSPLAFQARPLSPSRSTQQHGQGAARGENAWNRLARSPPVSYDPPVETSGGAHGRQRLQSHRTPEPCPTCVGIAAEHSSNRPARGAGVHREQPTGCASLSRERVWDAPLELPSAIGLSQRRILPMCAPLEWGLRGGRLWPPSAAPCCDVPAHLHIGRCLSLTPTWTMRGLSTPATPTYLNTLSSISRFRGS